MEQDIRIRCKDCGDSFLFTAAEQKYYEEKGLVPPKRCKKCREARKNNQQHLKF